MYLPLTIQMAGFVIGLGAVTVIDTLGFLGRTSPYWTEATTRAHKVTKPLIWIGMTLLLVGGWWRYDLLGARGPALLSYAHWHLLLSALLVANGCFLSFVVSPFLLRQEKAGRANALLPPSLQRKIAVSFVVSLLGWWGSLLLFIHSLALTRGLP